MENCHAHNTFGDFFVHLAELLNMCLKPQASHLVFDLPNLNNTHHSKNKHKIINKNIFCYSILRFFLFVILALQNILK